MRRCNKGKPCGATCIEKTDKCWKDAGPSIGKSLSEARELVSEARSKPFTLSPSAKAIPYSPSQVGSQSARYAAKQILSDLQKEGNVRKIDGKVKEGSINWSAALGSGSSYVGGGDYGSFVTISTKSLLGEKPDDMSGKVGIKTGRIGKNEVEALRIAGEHGLGPKLIGARLSSKEEMDMGNNPFYKGAIAMTKVGALPYRKVSEVWGNMGPKSDMLWKAAAELHRLGIAHNDMHGGNIFLSAADVGARARFVDFGLAQISPKAALVEAIGSIKGGNWQFPGSTTEGHAVTARRNLKRVENFLRGKGFNSDDIDEIFYTEIRRGEDSYKEGVWGRLSNRDAKKLIGIFYEGI